MAHNRLPSKLPGPGTAVMLMIMGLGIVITKPRTSSWSGPSSKFRISQPSGTSIAFTTAVKAPTTSPVTFPTAVNSPALSINSVTFRVPETSLPNWSVPVKDSTNGFPVGFFSARTFFAFFAFLRSACASVRPTAVIAVPAMPTPSRCNRPRREVESPRLRLNACKSIWVHETYSLRIRENTNEYAANPPKPPTTDGFSTRASYLLTG